MSSFTRELKVWINLSHANILPCLGFAKYESNPALISEWVENGSLPQYLNENTRANKLEMVCISNLVSRGRAKFLLGERYCMRIRVHPFGRSRPWRFKRGECETSIWISVDTFSIRQMFSFAMTGDLCLLTSGTRMW